MFLSKIRLLIGSLLLAGVLLGAASTAHAQTINYQDDLTKGQQIKSSFVTSFYVMQSGQSVTQTIFRVIIVIAVILFVVLMLVGGIQYLSSFGNEEATTKAKTLMIDAVIGLFITLAAFGVASFIFGQLGLNSSPAQEYITPK